MPDVPAEYDRTLTVGGKGGVSWQVDGKQHYVKHFTRAWNDCRDAFYRGDKLYFDNETNETGPWLSVVPGDMLDAQRLGWTTCRSQIEKLQERISNDQIQSEIVDQPWVECGILAIGLSVMAWPTLSRIAEFGGNQ